MNDTKNPATTPEPGCCGGPAKENPEACCALDAAEKAKGASGCGCSAPQPARTETTGSTSCCS